MTTPDRLQEIANKIELLGLNILIRNNYEDRTYFCHIFNLTGKDVPSLSIKHTGPTILQAAENAYQGLQTFLSLKDNT